MQFYGGESNCILTFGPLFPSGRLENLADLETRGRLINWPDRFEDIHTNDLSARSSSMQELAPALARHGFPRTVCPEDNFYVCSDSEAVPDSYFQLAKDTDISDNVDESSHVDAQHFSGS